MFSSRLHTSKNGRSQKRKICQLEPRISVPLCWNWNMKAKSFLKTVLLVSGETGAGLRAKIVHGGRKGASESQSVRLSIHHSRDMHVDERSSAQPATCGESWKYWEQMQKANTTTPASGLKIRFEWAPHRDIDSWCCWHGRELAGTLTEHFTWSDDLSRSCGASTLSFAWTTRWNK